MNYECSFVIVSGKAIMHLTQARPRPPTNQAIEVIHNEIEETTSLERPAADTGPETGGNMKAYDKIEKLKKRIKKLKKDRGSWIKSARFSYRLFNILSDEYHKTMKELALAEKVLKDVAEDDGAKTQAFAQMYLEKVGLERTQSAKVLLERYAKHTTGEKA